MNKNVEIKLFKQKCRIEIKIVKMILLKQTREKIIMALINFHSLRPSVGMIKHH